MPYDGLGTLNQIAFCRMNDTMQSNEIGIRELRGNLADVLRRVQLGQTFTITSNKAVIAELRPPAFAHSRRRVPGRLRGMVWMAPDFDEFPEDMLDAMEGKLDEVD